MQTIFAMHQNHTDNLEKEEKFLFYSIESIQELYLLLLSSLIEIRNTEKDFLTKSSQKLLATKEEKNPNTKFVDNKVLSILCESNKLSIALEAKKINNWYLNDEYIKILIQEIKESEFYKEYMKNPERSYNEDKELILNIYTNIIAPNTKIYDFIEDHKLTWIDDLPVVNTEIIRNLTSLKQNGDIKIPKIFKDEEDQLYTKNLFTKTVLNETKLAKEYEDKTPNWDAERIAEIDTIILKMAICEFLYFPSIPVKVTINEYLELAKEYSTPKSSIFINGILDNLVKEFESNDRIKKIGRGLL